MSISHEALTSYFDGFMVVVLIPIWVASHVIIDGEHLNRFEFIDDHRPRWINRALVVLLIAYYSIPISMYAAFMFWAFFDGLLNNYRGFEFFHTGTKAGTDIFFSDKKRLYVASKSASVLAAFVSLNIPYIWGYIQDVFK